MQAKGKLQDAAHDLRYLLDHGYKKKGAVAFVANRYLLGKRERNFLVRAVFSSQKSEDHKRKFVDIDAIKNKPLFVDGYNVIITTESIFIDRNSIVSCDDGVLRDINAVFGKYKITEVTKKALNEIIFVIKKYNPSYVEFFFDSPVSFSGELAGLTRKLMDTHGLEGGATVSSIVDAELVSLSAKTDGIVATSDSVIMDKVERVVDIPAYILRSIKKEE